MATVPAAMDHPASRLRRVCSERTCPPRRTATTRPRIARGGSKRGLLSPLVRTWDWPAPSRAAADQAVGEQAAVLAEDDHVAAAQAADVMAHEDLVPLGEGGQHAGAGDGQPLLQPVGPP